MASVEPARVEPARTAPAAASAAASASASAAAEPAHSAAEHTGQANWERVVERLVAERGDALTRYAFLVSGSASDASDLVQDALVKTFGRLRNGFTVASAEAYVRRAILNTYLDGGRRTTRWRKIAHLTAEPEEQESPAAASEVRIDLQQQLGKLAPRERACVVLRYYDDLKVDDIAQTLQISSGAVKRYLSDGLAKLAVALTDNPAGGTNAL